MSRRNGSAPGQGISPPSKRSEWGTLASRASKAGARSRHLRDGALGLGVRRDGLTQLATDRSVRVGDFADADRLGVRSLRRSSRLGRRCLEPMGRSMGIPRARAGRHAQRCAHRAGASRAGALLPRARQEVRYRVVRRFRIVAVASRRKRHRQCDLRDEGAGGLSSRSAHAKAAASASASPNRSIAKRNVSFFSNSHTYG